MASSDEVPQIPRMRQTRRREATSKFISVQADNRIFWRVEFLPRATHNGIYRILDLVERTMHFFVDFFIFFKCLQCTVVMLLTEVTPHPSNITQRCCPCGSSVPGSSLAMYA